MAEDGIQRSLQKGYPVTNIPMDPLARWLYTFGFTPTDVEKTYDISEQLFQSQKKMREAVTAFGKAWARMETEGDGRGLQELFVRATAQGVSMDSVWRSARAFKSKTGEGLLARRFKDADVRRLQGSIVGTR